MPAKHHKTTALKLDKILAKNRKNRKVNAALLAESLAIAKQLADDGVALRKGYNLPSPFEKRLVRTTVSELILSQAK
jgi:hypothetical protein